MFANNSFYGGHKGKDFKIDRIVPNAHHLWQDLSIGLVSDIPVGSYVMVTYGLKTNLRYIDNNQKEHYLEYIGNNTFKGPKYSGAPDDREYSLYKFNPTMNLWIIDDNPQWTVNSDNITDMTIANQSS
jgi:hypothetical protein